MTLGHPLTSPHRTGVVAETAAEAKVVAVVAFVMLAALTPARSAAALGADLLAVGVAAAVSGVGLRHLATRFAVALPFLIFAALLPLVGEGDRVDVAGVSLSLPGLWAAWGIGAKAGCGVMATTVLAATTPVPRLLAALAHLRVPAPFLAIAGFMLRYIDLLTDEMARVRTAMEARGYRARWLWQARPVATGTGAVFVRSFERGERVHAAMVARGYTGTMPVLHRASVRPVDWLRTLPLPLVAALGLIGSLW